jgi:hypothetical protein
LCDTRGGKTARFLHTASNQDKLGRPLPHKRDGTGKPLDKLPIISRKPLRIDELSRRNRTAPDMWSDVKKRG